MSAHIRRSSFSNQMTEAAYFDSPPQRHLDQQIYPETPETVASPNFDDSSRQSDWLSHPHPFSKGSKSPVLDEKSGCKYSYTIDNLDLMEGTPGFAFQDEVDFQSFESRVYKDLQRSCTDANLAHSRNFDNDKVTGEDESSSTPIPFISVNSEYVNDSFGSHVGSPDGSSVENTASQPKFYSTPINTLFFSREGKVLNEDNDVEGKEARYSNQNQRLSSNKNQTYRRSRENSVSLPESCRESVDYLNSVLQQTPQSANQSNRVSGEHHKFQNSKPHPSFFRGSVESIDAVSANAPRVANTRDSTNSTVWTDQTNSRGGVEKPKINDWFIEEDWLFLDDDFDCIWSSLDFDSVYREIAEYQATISARNDPSTPPPESSYTTVMLRHIPNKYTQSNLLNFLRWRCGQSFFETLDFFYLPIDFKNGCNMGYAFLNFGRNEDAISFQRQFSNYRLPAARSTKICVTNWARVQGFAANVDHYRSSPINSCHDDTVKPVLFDKHGHRMRFPSPPENSRRTIHIHSSKVSKDGNSNQQSTRTQIQKQRAENGSSPSDIGRMVRASVESSSSKTPNHHGNRNRSSRDIGHNRNKIFVGGLPVDVDSDELYQFFSDYGEVISATVVCDASGVSKGYAYCQFKLKESMDHVLSIQPLWIKSANVGIRPFKQ